jgi:DNA-binding LytR/AlgR family response regulator
MQTKLKCIIADDEPLARKGLENFIREVPFLELTGSCSNAIQAMEQLTENGAELLFLDIQMPKMSGIDMLRSMQQPPMVIITSAFPDYALVSYELNVLDYLVKPIPFERFVKAVTKARDFHDLHRRAPSAGATEDDFFFIKCEHRYEKIFFADIVYIEGLQNYVVIHTTKKRFISYLTMKSVGEYLPENTFLKINKSQIISLNRIETIEGNSVKLGVHSFTIGRTNKEEIMQRILSNKLLKRT